MITYKRASTQAELEQILELQKNNLHSLISSEEKKIEGFLTIQHDFDLLNKMNKVCPHIIAKEDEKVVGYALCMHPKFENEIDLLRPMFKQITKTLEQNKSDNPSFNNYIVMGQICIDKSYRKQGIFRKLYANMLQEIQPTFNIIITEVDKKNTRSLEAHYAMGFELLSKYRSGGQDWELISLK